MKILFLNSSHQWGGNEKWTLEASCGLAEMGHGVYLGCRSSIFEEKSWCKKLKFIKIPFYNNLDLITVLKLIKIIKVLEIDVLVPTKQREYFLGGLAACFFPSLKVAARLGIERPIDNLRNRIAFCKFFDSVIVNSRRIITTLARTPGFDTGKCTLVYNGVELPELSSEVRARYRHELGVGEENQLIAVIGRLAPQKGFDMALEAFAALHQIIPSVRMVLVGSGDFFQVYRDLAENLGIDKFVTFTGHRDDVSGFFQASDLFWLTSRKEGMANVMLEAMAHKKAVVAFNVAGVDEILIDGENGFIINQDTTNHLVECSEKILMDDKLKEQVGCAAFKTVKNDFSKEKMYSSLEKAFEELS